MESIRILIVEDEWISARELEITLSDMGHRVIGIAATGEEAIEKSGSLRPDIILMDINLAGATDGITAAGRIRALWSIPVIFITALVSRDAIELAGTTNPHGYIIKPITADSLYATG